MKVFILFLLVSTATALTFDVKPLGKERDSVCIPSNVYNCNLPRVGLCGVDGINTAQIPMLLSNQTEFKLIDKVRIQPVYDNSQPVKCVSLVGNETDCSSCKSIGVRTVTCTGNADYLQSDLCGGHTCLASRAQCACARVSPTDLKVIDIQNSFQLKEVTVGIEKRSLVAMYNRFPVDVTHEYGRYFQSTAQYGRRLLSESAFSVSINVAKGVVSVTRELFPDESCDGCTIREYRLTISINGIMVSYDLVLLEGTYALTPAMLEQTGLISVTITDPVGQILHYSVATQSHVGECDRPGWDPISLSYYRDLLSRFSCYDRLEKAGTVLEMILISYLLFVAIFVSIKYYKVVFFPCYISFLSYKKLSERIKENKKVKETAAAKDEVSSVQLLAVGKPRRANFGPMLLIIFATCVVQPSCGMYCDRGVFIPVSYSECTNDGAIDECSLTMSSTLSIPAHSKGICIGITPNGTESGALRLEVRINNVRERHFYDYYYTTSSWDGRHKSAQACQWTSDYDNWHETFTDYTSNVFDPVNWYFYQKRPDLFTGPGKTTCHSNSGNCFLHGITCTRWAAVMANNDPWYVYKYKSEEVTTMSIDVVQVNSDATEQGLFSGPIDVNQKVIVAGTFELLFSGYIPSLETHEQPPEFILVPATEAGSARTLHGLPRESVSLANEPTAHKIGDIQFDQTMDWGNPSVWGNILFPHDLCTCQKGVETDFCTCPKPALPRLNSLPGHTTIPSSTFIVGAISPQSVSVDTIHESSHDSGLFTLTTTQPYIYSQISTKVCPVLSSDSDTLNLPVFTGTWGFGGRCSIDIPVASRCANGLAIVEEDDPRITIMSPSISLFTEESAPNLVRVNALCADEVVIGGSLKICSGDSCVSVTYDTSKLTFSPSLMNDTNVLASEIYVRSRKISSSGGSHSGFSFDWLASLGHSFFGLTSRVSQIVGGIFVIVLMLCVGYLIFAFSTHVSDRLMKTKSKPGSDVRYRKMEYSTL